MVPRSDIFAPKRRLRPQNMRCLCGRKRGWHRVKRIDLFQREIAPDRQRLARLVGLVIVEIAMRRGSYDDIMACTGCCDASLYAAPRHDDRALWQNAFQNLIPADHMA